MARCVHGHIYCTVHDPDWMPDPNALRQTLIRDQGRRPLTIHMSHELSLIDLNSVTEAWTDSPIEICELVLSYIQNGSADDGLLMFMYKYDRNDGLISSAECAVCRILSASHRFFCHVI